MLNMSVVPGAVVANLGPLGGRPEVKSEHSKNGWQSGMIERPRADGIAESLNQPQQPPSSGGLGTRRTRTSPRVCQPELSFLLLAA